MAETGIEFPLIEADAADDRAAGRVRRPGRLRVRRVDLGRPVSLDPRGSAAPAPGRSARVPAQLDARDPLLGRRRAGKGAARPSRSSACTASSGRTAASSSTCRTASGSTCCARTASRSSVWSRSRHRPTRRRTSTTRMSPPTGRGSGRARRSGSRGDVTVDPLILASTSPQRRAILEQLGIPFDVVAPDFHEAPGTSPLERAAGKARSVDGGERPVLGVDTEVLLDGELLGKPANATEAEAMLESLVGSHTRGLLGPLPAHAGLGGAARRIDVRHVPHAHAARPRPLPRGRASGRAAPAPMRSRASARAWWSESRATS